MYAIRSYYVEAAGQYSSRGRGSGSRRRRGRCGDARVQPLEQVMVACLPLQILLDRMEAMRHHGVNHFAVVALFQRPDAGVDRQLGDLICVSS